MVQIKNISELRKNLAQMVKQVDTTGESIIILQDSHPVAEIVPFAQKTHQQTITMNWFDELEKVIEKGKKKLLLENQ